MTNLLRSYFCAVSVIAVALAACDDGLPTVKRALEMAGDNRPELEKVLEHYRQDPADSLKYRAAEYLIRYMPYHTSIGGAYDAYFDTVDSLLSLPDRTDVMQKIERVSDSLRSAVFTQRDIRAVTAEYLIRNIEAAFTDWRQTGWAYHLDFDLFCEFLLPYKCIDTQPLDNWREALKNVCRSESYDQIQQNYDYEYNPLASVSRVNGTMKKSVSPQIWLHDLKFMPITRPTTFLKMSGGTCWDYATSAIQLMRSKGLPVAIDFTPQWPDRTYGHSWCVVHTTRGINLMFNPFASNPNYPHYVYARFSKIFRQTYKVNGELYRLLSQGVEMPAQVIHLCTEDVTHEYERTSDLKIRLFPEYKREKMAYIATFDNKSWVPVYWGKVRRGYALFKNMGHDVTYMAMICRDSNLEPASLPFTVSAGGEIRYMEADTTRKQRVVLDRKNPMYQHVFYKTEYLGNGLIEASDHPDFRQADTVAMISRWKMTSGTVLPPRRPYRYWRLRAAGGDEYDMAEIYFFREGDKRPVKGRLISSGRSLDREHLPEHIADDNPETYCRVKGTDYWVGFDFGEPVGIDRISYRRRGDGNAICVGDTYDIYYWDNRKWVLADTQEATDVTLETDRLPADGLYFIRGNRGYSQRIFTWENNRVRWH